jgi:hypothetical protein
MSCHALLLHADLPFFIWWMPIPNFSWAASPWWALLDVPGDWVLLCASETLSFMSISSLTPQGCGSFSLHLTLFSLHGRHSIMIWRFHRGNTNIQGHVPGSTEGTDPFAKGLYSLTLPFQLFFLTCLQGSKKYHLQSSVLPPVPVSSYPNLNIRCVCASLILHYPPAWVSVYLQWPNLDHSSLLNGITMGSHPSETTVMFLVFWLQLLSSQCLKNYKSLITNNPVISYHCPIVSGTLLRKWQASLWEFQFYFKKILQY